MKNSSGICGVKRMLPLRWIGSPYLFFLRCSEGSLCRSYCHNAGLLLQFSWLTQVPEHVYQNQVRVSGRIF